MSLQSPVQKGRRRGFVGIVAALATLVATMTTCTQVQADTGTAGGGSVSQMARSLSQDGRPKPRPGTTMVAGADGTTYVESTQCLKPVSERVGGWMCLDGGPAPRVASSPAVRGSAQSLPTPGGTDSPASTASFQNSYCTGAPKNTCWYAGTDDFRGRYAQTKVAYGYGDQQLGLQQSASSYALNGFQASGTLGWQSTRGERSLVPTVYTYGYDGHGGAWAAGGGSNGNWGNVNANTYKSWGWKSYYKGITSWYYTGFGVTFQDAEFPGTWGLSIPSAIYWCTSGAKTNPCAYSEGATPPSGAVEFWYEG
jgi:hypothetical protein